MAIQQHDYLSGGSYNKNGTAGGPRMHQTLTTTGRPELPLGYNDYLTMNNRVNTAGYPKIGQLPNNNFKIRQNRV